MGYGIAKKAKIALEDGRIFTGYSFGASGERYGELVFNTSMTGYAEILTDPSYKGQIVAMTYPLVGNYGITSADSESIKIFLEAFVVKECSRIASNWRSEEDLSGYLVKNNVVGIEGVDTRALTRHIRMQGALKAVVSTTDLDDQNLIHKAKTSVGLLGRDLVREVTLNKAENWNDTGRYKVVVIDCGVKFNILKELVRCGCKVTVVPAAATAEEIMRTRPDGLLLSNGPGDPAGVPYVVETVRQLLGQLPIMGICLGHQMLGLALGGSTYKLKFGHHGANHPVKDVRSGRIAITVQNHGFCVDADSLDPQEISITHINLNDHTLEGMRHKRMPAFSVQFHPEASAGPHDARYLFGEFIGMMQEKEKKHA